MASIAPSAFIVALPKAELHLHLEGSIDPPTVLELKERHGKKGTLTEVEQLYRYKDFTGFLLAFKSVTEELQTPEDYELITYRLMEKLKADNVLHAEVYVSVGVCLWRKQDFDSLFAGLERGRERGERDFGTSLLWIFDAVRRFTESHGHKGNWLTDFVGSTRPESKRPTLHESQGGFAERWSPAFCPRYSQSMNCPIVQVR